MAEKKRYVEYDLTTGKILSEMTSEIEPVDGNGVGYLKISEDYQFDVINSVVKDGKIRRAYETTEERAEKERLQAELAAKGRSRLKLIIFEFVRAMLEDDNEKIAALKAEHEDLKKYW